MTPLRPIPHPRSIFRSRFFWFALPGLIFLLWGWFNDPAYYDSIRFRLGDHALTIADNGRQACLNFTNFTPGRGLRIDPGHWLRSEVKGEEFEQTLFSEAIVCRVVHEPHAFRFNANVAYWLIILLHLAALIPTWLWWQRRKSRLITATQPQPSATHS
jgi:hypothetical protein